MHLVVYIKQLPDSAQASTSPRNTVMRRQMLRTSTLSGEPFIHFTPEAFKPLLIGNQTRQSMWVWPSDTCELIRSRLSGHGGNMPPLAG